MEVLNTQPILSIVIPTKNRYEYLEILIKVLLETNSNEFELIIQDNSDDNSMFLKYINHYSKDKRLKYSHTSGWLSVIDNCDLGINSAIGIYICMLGDDDGILLENSITLCHWLLERKIDAALVNVISYSWPDITHAVWGDRFSGKLENKLFSFKSEIIETKKELVNVCKTGGSIGLGKLPRVYHAFVSKQKLVELNKETRTNFPGPSPDMANAVGLCKYIDQYIYVDFPSIIAGHSKKSTAGQGGMKEHHGAIENQSHLPKNTKQEWTREIPLFWSGPTIYAESASKALEKTNNYSYSLNYSYLYACCLVYEKQYKSKVIKKMLNQKSILIGIFVCLKVIINVFLIFLKRSVNFLKNIVKYRISKNAFIQASNINEAISILRSKNKNVFIKP